MGDKLKQAAKTAGALAVLVSVEKNDVHNEVEAVRFAGLPIFKRDAKGNPRIFGIRFKRLRGPRAEE